MTYDRTHARSPAASFSANGALLLRILIIVGYPLSGILVTYAGVESTVITFVYRGMVGLLAIALLFDGLRHKQAGRFSGLLLAFFAIYFARLVHDCWVEDVHGAGRALLFYLAVVLLPVLASQSASLHSIQEWKFATGALAAAIFVLALSVLAQSRGMAYNPWADYGVETNRLGFEALNPISLGHVGGLAILCSAYILFEVRHRSGVPRIMSIAGLFLGGLTLLYANSRGPILAAGVALVWFALSHVRRFIFLAPLVLLVPIFLTPDNFLVAQVIERFGGDFELNASNAGRLASQRLAMEAFWDNPLVGAWYIDPRLGDGEYPHNITIETAMALGLVGLALFFGMLLKAGLKIVSFYSKEHPFLTMLFVQQFIATSFSGALWSADAFFLMLSLCLTAQRQVATIHGTAQTWIRPATPRHARGGQTGPV